MASLYLLQEALARARQGDHTAFGDLVRHYEGMVFSLAYHSVHDRAVAEELAQEVFLRLLQSPPRCCSCWVPRHIAPISGPSRGPRWPKPR